MFVVLHLILEVIAALMSKEEIIRLAASSINRPIEKELLDSMSMSCRALLFDLMNTYALYRRGFIGKEEGERLKSNSISRYDLDARTEESYKNDLQHMAKLWKAIEETASIYRKDPSIAHADAFLEAVYGVGRLKEGDRD